MTSPLNTMPSEEENNKLKELFIAIYFNDLEKIIEFKKQYPEIYAKKNNFLIDENTTFDLTNLTFFNQTIWLDAEWERKIMPLVKKHRQRTEQVLGFWHSESGQIKTHRQIEYNHYWNYFFCEDPDDFDEINAEPISSYLKKGYREIDLRLYNRSQCFDFAEVKKLLEHGAKSHIHFEEDKNSSAFFCIALESSYLVNCHVIPEFEAFETKGYNQDFDTTEMFGNLLGLAAYEEMYHLLDEYGKEE